MSVNTTMNVAIPASAATDSALFVLLPPKRRCARVYTQVAKLIATRKAITALLMLVFYLKTSAFPLLLPMPRGPARRYYLESVHIHQ